MANLKEVRERITSVKSTQQITKAMKMVSAAKLRRAQQAITAVRPYSNKLNEMLKNILSNLEGDVSSSFGVQREVTNVLMVVSTSSKGLCGAFNNNVIKSALATMKDKYPTQLANGNITVMPVGKKAFEFFKKMDNVKMNNKYAALNADLSFDKVSDAAQMIMDAFEAGNYDAVEVSYGRFQNAVVQEPITDQFLPVAKIEAEGEESKTKADYIFEPDK
ncbi:MAG: F0F1 ATP synthase subunit gamma, partial [Saprospiraceae bacterium]